MRKYSTVWKFIFYTTIAAFFFLLPVQYNSKITVPFDVVISFLKFRFPFSTRLYTYIIIMGGALFTLISLFSPKKEFVTFKTSKSILFFRVLGAVLATLYFLFPSFSLYNIPNLIFNTLAVAVALIIPIGAIFVQLFVYYGGLEFIGTLASPFMPRLFKLPGYAALDALTSWVGSYSIGLYLTKRVYQKGLYTKKHVAILATCFSTVSVGFVGVIASTLNLLPYFPILLLMYFFAVVYLTIILVRIPPLSLYAEKSFNGKVVMVEKHPVQLSILKDAWNSSIRKCESAPPLREVVVEGFGDGITLTMKIIGTIVSIGTIALFLAKATPIFQWIGYPFIYLLRIFHLPSSPLIGAAIVSEISEMYIPALLVVNQPLDVRFFIALMSISQLLFFSSLGPMIIEMFQDIPITIKDLLLLFFLRTLLLLPFCAICLYILHILNM